MKRPGTRAATTLLTKIRDRVPGVAFRTTFIVGFPAKPTPTSRSWPGSSRPRVRPRRRLHLLARRKARPPSARRRRGGEDEDGAAGRGSGGAAEAARERRAARASGSARATSTSDRAPSMTSCSGGAPRDAGAGHRRLRVSDRLRYVLYRPGDFVEVGSWPRGNTISSRDRRCRFRPSVVRQAFGRRAIAASDAAHHAARASWSRPRSTPTASRLDRSSGASKRNSPATHHCRFGVMSTAARARCWSRRRRSRKCTAGRTATKSSCPRLRSSRPRTSCCRTDGAGAADVDPLYYELDPSRLEARSPRRAPSSRCTSFGQPADVDAIRAITDPRDRIIEDSCETMFANHNGRRVGSLGDIGRFSTYVAHSPSSPASAA